jgi:hypothetical protein
MMPLGAEHTQTTVNATDTAELTAYVYEKDDTAVELDDLASVTFTVRRPDGTIMTNAGTIQPDGSAFYRFTDTTQTGLHVWTAQFTFTSGEKRTFRDEFWVQDPLEVPPVSQATEIAEQVWMRLEDCFDSEQGGPWLRDMTLAFFEPNKVERFVSEGMMRINSWPPATNLDLSYFTTPVINPDPNLPPGTLQADPDRIVIVQATLLSVIRHLMRAYVEQPAPQGANVVWQDRRDYLQRWSTIYELEDAAFKEMVALWKRQFYNFGTGSLLVHTKAGRVYPYGGAWRARNAGRGPY